MHKCNHSESYSTACGVALAVIFRWLGWQHRLRGSTLF